MKRLFHHRTYSLFVLLYYSFCILDSAFSDTHNAPNGGVNRVLNTNPVVNEEHKIAINEPQSIEGHNILGIDQIDNPSQVNEGYFKNNPSEASGKGTNEEIKSDLNEKAREFLETVERVTEGEKVAGVLVKDESSRDVKVENPKANPQEILLPRPQTAKPPLFVSANKISNGIINDTPIILTLEDTATKELQEKATLHHAEIVTQSQNPLDQEKGQSLGDSNVTKDGSTIIQTTEENKFTPELSLEKREIESLSGEGAESNITKEKAVTEEIPSFSEWAQKHLEEAEKREPANSSTHQPQNQTKPGSGAKLRWKNYASVDCGSKVINANPEAQNTWAILSPSRDEYKLSPCNSRVWFIVELCEAIQVKKIDLANYELFSSSPKEFVVSVGDRYPTRDWMVVGQFTAKDERDIQSFDLNHEHFGKYVKIEIKSHYGSEHYCPLSLFRAYGTSVFEVLQKEDPGHMQQNDDDDDDILEPNEQKTQTSGNLLSSATDAVISMVKKAASVLGNKSNQSDMGSFENISHKSIMMQTCNSPSHYVVCNNCTDELFGKIYEILSCRPTDVIKLLKIPFVTKSMVNSKICKKFGFDFRNKTSKVSIKSLPKCVETFFSEEQIGAMCNILAITFNKVLRNVSYQYGNITSSKDEKLVDINDVVLKDKDASNPGLEDKIVIEPTKTLDLDRDNIIVKPSELNLDNSALSGKILDREQNVNAKIESSIVELDSKRDTGDKKIVEVDELLPKVLEVPEILESLPNIEVIKENLEVAEENLETLLADSSDTVTNGEHSTIPSLPPNNVNLQAQKESVFLRLSNRIRALERNMSLSSQYLEELSKRYKKQVEEMQRNLDRTNKMMDEVHLKHAEYNKRLEERLEYLTVTIDNVLLERDIWRIVGSVFCIIFVTFLVFSYCGRRPLKANIPKTDSSKTSYMSDVKKSSHPIKIIVSSPCKRDKSLPKVKKKKKSHVVHLDPNLVTKKEVREFSPRRTSTKIWREDGEKRVEGRRGVEDIPFVLEEGDNSTLEILPDPKITLRIPQGMKLSKIPPAQPINPKDKLTIYADKIHQENNSNGRRSSESSANMNGNVALPNGNVGHGDGIEATPKIAKKGFKNLFRRVLSKD